jgi:hypothetical protein
MGRRGYWALLAGIAALVTFTGAATAQDARTLERQRFLNERALAAAKAQEYDRAIVLFEAALDLGPSNITYLNLGRTLYYAGRCQEALDTYVKALDAPGPPDINAERIFALAARYKDDLKTGCPARVTVRCAPATMLLLVDGEQKTCGQALTLSPGVYSFEGIWGRDRNEVTLEVTPGESREVNLEVLPSDGVAVTPPPARAQPPAPRQPLDGGDDGANTPQVVGWVMGGLSVASAGLGLWGWSQHSQASQSLAQVSSTPGASTALYQQHKDELDSASTWMALGFGASAMLAAGSGFLLYLGYSDAQERAPAAGAWRLLPGLGTVHVKTEF